jgi:hypothetical protein
MSLVALGTPGGLAEISSIALHIASMWPRPVTVVEADPDGGRLAVRHNWPIRPGLGALAASLNQSPQGGWAWQSSREVSGQALNDPKIYGRSIYGSDFRVIPAPAAPDDVITAVSELAVCPWRIEEVLGTDVLISVGTIRPGSPASALIERADARLLVMRCTIEDVSAVLHRRHLLQSVGSWTVLTAGGRLDTVDVARVIHWPVLADLLPSDRRNSLVLRQRIEEFATTLRTENANPGAVTNNAEHR